MPSTETPPSRISPARLLGTALYLVLWPGLVLLVSGDWRWIEGWMFGVWFLALSTTAIVWLYRKDPALLAERYRKPGSGGQTKVDTGIVYGLVAGFTSWIVVMPLDAKRFGFTPHLPLWLEACGAAMLLASSFLLLRSFTDNTFLSPLVRIQAERKQSVVSTGVYGFVRHPMYLGAIAMFVGAPLLLGSACGIALGAALGILLAVRVVEEEKVLVRDLTGYEEYRKKVRYRLVPFIW